MSQDQIDPAEALAMARQARTRIVAHAYIPGWYAPLYGLLCGGIVAGGGLGQPLGIVMVGVCVALLGALYRTWSDVEQAVQAKPRVRLCKGAYKEPATVAFPDKREVDANYIKCMHALMEQGTYPALATHDPAIIAEAKRFAKERAIDPSRFEFQMLYGIRRDVQEQLVAEGYRMRVYVPFGTQWYPYLMRRLAERPANLGFVAKNLLRG